MDAAFRVNSGAAYISAVATEIGGGHEIWLRRGLLVDAIRASYALPGVFEPVKIDGRWLFDGAIVNPVPVSVARALGAERVIALNISSDRFGRGAVIQDPFGRPEPPPAAEEPPPHPGDDRCQRPDRAWQDLAVGGTGSADQMEVATWSFICPDKDTWK